MSKLKKFQEEAAKAEQEYLTQFTDPVEETKDVKPEVPAEEQPTETTEVKADTDGAKTEEVAPEPTTEPSEFEKKYKDSLKGMNEAQRKAAESAKIAEDAQKRSQELEARLNEFLENAKKAQSTTKAEPVEEELDDLERDLPEVSKIARKNADRVQRALEQKLAELEKWKVTQEERVRAAEQESLARSIYSEVSKVHPDYEQVVGSDEMVAWINNEAPPIYKAIFEGTVPSTAKDRILVLDAFKHTTTPTKKVVTASTPGAAEVAAPVKTNTPISTKPKSEEPLSEKDLDYFMHNSQRMSQEELAKWNTRIEAML